MKRIIAITMAVVAMGTGPVQFAEAQNVAAADSGKQRTLEEVVVTARRRAENLQTIPVSVTAFSAQNLARQQITTAQDLQGRVPSLSISSNGQMRNTQALTLRGQGGTFGGSPGVVIYYSEVPLPADFPWSTQGGPGKFFDVASLQVLRGPQGTLFGRNTTGGAMLIEPQKPENRFSGSLQAGGSTYNGQDYEAIVNVPIVDDTLLMRAGYKYVNRDGFTRDITTGRSLDNKHFSTYRLGVTWQPTENIENYLLGYYTDSNTNGTGIVIEGFNAAGLNQAFPGLIATQLGVPVSSLPSILPSIASFLNLTPAQAADINNLGCNFFNANAPSTNCGADIVAAQKDRGIRKIRTSLLPHDEIQTAAGIDKFSYVLGKNLTLRNIVSYTTYQHAFNWDADGSRAIMQDLATVRGEKAYDVSQTTEEMQLQGSGLDDMLKYTLGGYYERTKPEGPQGQVISALFFTQPASQYKRKQESYAPYAQGTFDFGGVSDALDGLTLTLGVRYTKDKIEGSSGAGGIDHSATLKSDAWTYTAGLDYRFGGNLVYGKISRGYKAGGFSATAVVPADYTFKPEHVTSYEIGQKSDFRIGDTPVRINSAAYYSEYSDMQRGGIDVEGTYIGSAVYNAGKATIYGFEFDGMVQPFDGFTLSVNYAYTHGSYNKFDLHVNSASPQLDCSGALVYKGGVVNLSCAPFQNAPKNQFSVTASYDIVNDPGIGLINGLVSYAWVDRQYASAYSLPAAEPGAWLPSFGLLSASVSWNRIFGSDFDVMVYGTNLTDKDYRISNSNVWNLNYFRSSIYGEPRIIGAKLIYRWGR